jgi:hypothetical protein
LLIVNPGGTIALDAGFPSGWDLNAVEAWLSNNTGLSQRPAGLCDKAHQR